MKDKIRKIKLYRTFLKFEKNFKKSIILRYSLSNRNISELKYDLKPLCKKYNVSEPTIIAEYDKKNTYVNLKFEEERFILKIHIRNEGIGI